MVLGAAIISKIITCPYANDPDLEVNIGTKIYRVGNLANKSVECFDLIFKDLEEGVDEFVEVTLRYSEARKAKFHSQNIIFVIKPEYHDFYYLEKELKRRGGKE